MSRFQTDALRPSALPTASLGRPRPLLRTEPDRGRPSGDAQRDKFHFDWNLRIDKEVRGVANGLKELVELADIGTNPSPHANQLTALHLKLRTAQLIRAAQTLRDTAHELKLMLLLSDEVDTARRRDAEMRVVRAEVKRGMEEVGREVGRLLGGVEAEGREESQDQGLNGGSGEDARAAEGDQGNAGSELAEPPSIEQAGLPAAAGGEALSTEPAALGHVTQEADTSMEVDDEDESDFEEVPA